MAKKLSPVEHNELLFCMPPGAGKANSICERFYIIHSLFDAPDELGYGKICYCLTIKATGASYIFGVIHRERWDFDLQFILNQLCADGSINVKNISIG